MDAIKLPVDVLYELIDALNSGSPEETSAAMDRLTEVAESQGVPVWFDENKHPVWMSKPKAG